MNITFGFMSGMSYHTYIDGLSQQLLKSFKFSALMWTIQGFMPNVIPQIFLESYLFTDIWAKVLSFHIVRIVFVLFGIYTVASIQILYNFQRSDFNLMLLSKNFNFKKKCQSCLFTYIVSPNKTFDKNPLLFICFLSIILYICFNIAFRFTFSFWCSSRIQIEEKERLF